MKTLRSMFNIGFIAFLLTFILNPVFTSEAFASQPEGIVESDIRKSKVTISWLTDVSESAQINYGTTPSLGNTAYDKRGSGFSGTTHYVEISFLSPDTLYYYDIVSGSITYDNGGAHYTVTTGSSLDPQPGSDIAYGQVKSSNGDPVVGAIVYLKLQNGNTLEESQFCSSLVDENGWWFYELKNVRNETLNDYFIYMESGDTLILEARDPNFERVSLEVDTANDSPAPDIVLANTPPVISNIFPTTGYITTDRKVPFKATIQDNGGLATFRMICFDHMAEAITGDIWINDENKGEYILKGNGGYVNFPTEQGQAPTDIEFEFRPKTDFYVNPAYGSYTRHIYWIGVYDTSGHWTSKAAIFYIYQNSGSSGTPGGGGCFLAGTPILMADGSTKPIEKIKLGDTIATGDRSRLLPRVKDRPVPLKLAAGEEPSKLETVKRVFVFPKEQGYYIINGKIQVTGKHRFYTVSGERLAVSGNSEHRKPNTENRYIWKEAKELKPGDTLLGSDNEPIEVTSIKHIETPVTVYNLEVNPYHTFIADGVVAHNAAFRREKYE